MIIPRKIIFISEDSETHEEIKHELVFTTNVDANMNYEIFPERGMEKFTLIVEQTSSLAMEVHAMNQYLRVTK